MAYAPDIRAVGPEVVQNLDNPTSIPTVRFDGTRHPSGIVSTTNEFPSTIPTGQIIPTASSSAYKNGDTVIISYTSSSGSLTETGLLIATGQPHASKTVTSHSTVTNEGTSTSTHTTSANETTTAGSGAPRAYVQHVGIVNVMVVGLVVAGVFGGVVAL